MKTIILFAVPLHNQLINYVVTITKSQIFVKIKTERLYNRIMFFTNESDQNGIV